MAKIFKRERYLKKIDNELWDKDNILFLIWARQVWKTSLLNSLIEFWYIKKNEYLFLYWDEIANKWIEKYWDLENYIFESIEKNKLKFLIIDEAQYIKNIWIILKILIDHVRRWDFDFKIIVTWSWSLEVFRWITDSLIWRKEILNIYSLSFLEFLEYKKFDFKLSFKNKNISQNISIDMLNKLDSYYQEFCLFWWYPKVVIEKSEEKKMKILNNLYSDYIQKDIWYYLKTGENIYFDKFLKYIWWWVCSAISVNKIVKDVWISKRLVDKFIFLVENTFVVNFLPAFYKNKQKEISKSKKVYFSDLWFLRKVLWISFIWWDNKWKFTENFVFLELLKYKSDIEEIFYYWKKSKAEIDFILKNDLTWKIYPIEVKSWSTENIPIIFKSFLQDYSDEIEKFYIVNKNTIKNRNIWEWELKKEIKIISYLNLFQNF